jgi:phosphonoacetate hydrolase
MVYLSDPDAAASVRDRIAALAGVDIATVHDEACHRFDLPADRTGDIVVFADGASVVGTRPSDHDLSALEAPLRSHGGRAEQEVPLFANRRVVGSRPRHNYDAFDVALNGSV